MGALSSGCLSWCCSYLSLSTAEEEICFAMLCILSMASPCALLMNSGKGVTCWRTCPDTDVFPFLTASLITSKPAKEFEQLVTY